MSNIYDWHSLNSRDDDDYYSDEDRMMERQMERSRNMTCRCTSMSEEPCTYCMGDYMCPDGCGHYVNDCQCEEMEYEDE